MPKMTAEPQPPNGDDDDRDPGNVIGLIVAILLIVGGAYLVIELMDSVKYQKCAASGRRNCDTIDINK